MLHVADILEMGVVTRQFTELAGRTISTPSDVVMALIDLGIAVTELPDFLAKCRSQGSLVIAQRKYMKAVKKRSA